MDDQARGLRPGRALGVRDGEQHLTIAAAQHPDVRDLPAALGVERRAIQDDLGIGGRLGTQLDLGQRRQLLVRRPVAEDRDHASLGGRGVVAQELRRADAAEQVSVQRRVDRGA